MTTTHDHDHNEPAEPEKDMDGTFYHAPADAGADDDHDDDDPPPLIDACAVCDTVTEVSDDGDGTIEFYAPVCDACRAAAIREMSMDDFDLAYARARANGWAD